MFMFALKSYEIHSSHTPHDTFLIIYTEVYILFSFIALQVWNSFDPVSTGCGVVTPDFTFVSLTVKSNLKSFRWPRWQNKYTLKLKRKKNAGGSINCGVLSFDFSGSRWISLHNFQFIFDISEQWFLSVNSSIREVTLFRNSCMFYTLKLQLSLG